MAYTLHFSGLSEGVRDHDIDAFLCSGQFGYPTIYNVNCGGSEATVVISGLQDCHFEQLLKSNAFPNATITVPQQSDQHVNANYGQGLWSVGPGAMAYPGHPQWFQGQPTQWGQPQFGGLHSSPASSVQSLPASFGQQWTGDRPAFRHVADQGLCPQGMNTRMPESVSNSPFQATQGTPGFSPRLPTHGRPTHPDQSGHPAMQPHLEPASFLPIRPEPLRPGPSYVPPTGQQLPRPPGPHDHRSHSVQQDPMSPPGQDGHSTPRAHQGIRPTGPYDHRSQSVQQDPMSPPGQEDHGTPYGHQGSRHTGPHDHRSQSVQQDYRPPPGQEGHRPSYGHQDDRPSSVQQEYRPSSVQHQYRPSSVQQDYGPSVQQQYGPPPGQESHIPAYGHQYSRPPSVQHEYRPPPGQQEYRPPPGQHEYRPSPISQGNQIHLTSANESCPTAHGFRPTFASQEYRPLSASHDVRPPRPSSTQEYRSPSTPHDFRPPSTSHDTSTSEEVEEINSHSHDMQPSPMQTNQPIMVLHGGTEGQQSAVHDSPVPEDDTWEHPANLKEDSPQAQEQADTENPSSQLCTPLSSHHITSSPGVLATTSLKSGTDSPTLPEQTVVDVPTSKEGMLSAGSKAHVHAQQQLSFLSQSQHQQLQYSFHPSTMSTNSPLYQEHSSQYPPQMPQYQHSSQYPPQMPQYQHSSQYPPQMPQYQGDTPHASTQHLQYSPGTRPPMVSSLESQRRQSLPIQQGSHSHMQYTSTNPPESMRMHGPPPHSLSEPNPGSTTAQWEGRHLYHGGSNTPGSRRHPSTAQWPDGSLDHQDSQWHTPHHQQVHGYQRQPIFQPGRGLEHTDDAFSLAGQQLPVQFETHQEASYGEHCLRKDPYTFEQIASNEEISLATNSTCNPLQSSPAVVTQPGAHVSPHTSGVSDQSANFQGGSHETPSHHEPKSSNSKSDLTLDLVALLDNNGDSTSIVKITDLELEESDLDTIDDVFSNEDEGGGELVGIDITQLKEKGFILITFKDPGVAKQVCKKKQWRVMGQTAFVCLYCKDTNAIQKLLAVARNHPQHAIIILNLPDSELNVDVSLRLEKITKLDLEDSTTDKYEHVGTKALLVLSNGDPDFKDSIVSKINNYRKIPKPHKNFAQISALNFPQVNKVIITGIKDEMCHEHKLQPYFSNRKKSGGGPGCSVEVVDRGRAVVSFKESAQADSTLETDHEKTLGEGVTVQPYHPLFEGWLSISAAAKDTHVQQDFDCEVQSEQKCAYLTKSSHHLNEFNNSLKEHCATVILDASQKVFHVKPRQGSQYIKEWKANCKRLIEEFLESYREDLVGIPEGTSGVAFKLLFTVAKDYPLVEVKDSQAAADHESVSVVGPAADVTTVVERLQRVVNESMDFNEVVKFAPAVLHYVHNHARKKLKEKHPRVDFKASLQEGCIEVIGKTAKCEEFIEALNKLKPSSARVNISPDAVHLLASPVGREYILDKMSTQVEISHFFTDENDALEDAQMAIYVNLYIVADSSLSAQVHQVAKDIESSLCTTKIDVPKEFQYTVRSQAWNDFKEGVEQRCVAQLLPHAADPLVVICDHQLTEQLAQEIESFVQENCYTEETVTFSSGQWRFLFDYSREWILIEDEIKKTCKYNCEEEGRSTAIHLQGETTPSKTLAKKVRNLRDSICADKMEVSRPGLVTHFFSEEGQRHIKGIAAARKTVVEVSTAEEKEHYNEMIAQEKTHPVLISGTLADGVIVEVRKGDLTEFEVDVIVNAANEQLSHGGGVAGQLRSKGGPIIQKESDQYVRRNGSVDIGKAVIHKSTGDLPCKNIVHAVGPRWRGGNHNESHLLSRAVSASLTETVKKGFTSIAFPAIGAGIFGVPIEVCTKAMFEGLCGFFSMSKHQLKVIIMVYQQEHVEPFISAARKSLNDVVEPKMHVMTEHPSGTAPMPRRTSSRTMASAITTDLEISHGSLLDYHADVYINSTSTGLDLSSGAVSMSLLRTGGSALQDECTQHVQQNGSVPEWGFFTSGPGNLKCRKVIHTVGGNYNGGSGKRGMETMITNVMKECDRLKTSTVAFPSIGTGALHFPPDVAADIMITTVSTYLSQHRTTAIKKVLFVIFDQPVLKAYKAKEATLPAVQPQLSSASSSTRRHPSAYSRTRSRGSNTPTVKLSKLSFQPQPTRPVIRTQIQQGSLTDVVTDVYVDTTSADLDLKSRPVSQALLQAGGQALQDECTKHVQQNGNVPAWSFATTGPGTLKCKHVLHTVAAEYGGPGGSAEKGLEQMMMDMLTECDNLKATTVAIPSIGAGNLSFPPDVVARIMIQSVSNYGQKNSGTALKTVTFAIFDNTVLQCFQSMHSRLSSSPAAMPRLTSQAGFKVSPCINIQQGSLSNVVTDVYVDTTSADLDLKSRPVSKALLEAGGQALQDECTKHVQQNDKVPAWSFATTGPGTLKCKHVLHTVAAEYDGPGGSAEKGMEDMLHRVLEECERLKAKSVAIPSIGAGNFRFPPSVLASLMLRTVSSYLDKNRNSTVTKVLFVIFDGNLLKEFQEAQSGSARTHPATKSKSSAAARSNECTLQCYNLRVSIVHGDITKESSEAIVNTAADDLELKNFGVQGAFLRMGGPELQAECRAVVQNEGRLSGNKIRVTGPGRMGGLKCRQVLHILAPKTPVKLKGTVKAILNAVNKLGLRTVALPAIGTGQHGFKTDQAAKHICEAIVEFSKHPNALLREVRIIVFDKSLCSDFFTKFQSNGERLGVWAAIKGHFFNAADAMGKWLGAANDSKDDSANDDEEDSNQSCTEQLSDQFSSMSHQPYRELSYLVLSVYAQTKEIVSTVIEELQAVVDKEFVTEPMQEDLIQELSDDVVAELYQRAGDLQVELDLDREVGSVTIKGAKTNVGQAKLFLKEILHQIEMTQTAEQFEVEKARKEEQEMEKQSILAASVFRWQRIISDQFEDFPHDVSFFIEHARLDNQPACRIPGEAGEEYEVDFASMIIRDGSGNSGEVRRFDFEEDRKQAQRQLEEGAHIVYPTHWEPMPVDSKGREAVFHPVVLSANDQEYKEVLQGFEKTMTTQFNPKGMSHYTSILAIKRIQNPTLYSTYVTRKTVMEKANPKGTQNERRLFHGCAFDAAANICQTGFNRSFCGKNATAIGKGSYFAVNASYSASDTYSPCNNNDNGRKHIFLARVLTGEFTQGHSSLQDPPSKDGQSKFDSVVNSTASPGMYVVFYDTQAYPDYLIEFN